MALVRLFRKLSKLDAGNPSVVLVREIIADDELFAALRYAAGPPVSEDDLGVLVTRKVSGIAKTALASDNALPLAIFEQVRKMADPFRFPWVAEGRSPTTREMREALASTSALHASQSLQTERRKYGRVVEQQLVARLLEVSYMQVSGGKGKSKSNAGESSLPLFPAMGRVLQPGHHPRYPNFYGECIVYGRKVDLLIALRSGVVVAVEAKDSGSALNGIKRLLNDTMAKATAYFKAAGEQNVINVALLSGVFKVPDLLKAQGAGLKLVWAHDLDEFVEWIGSQN